MVVNLNNPSIVFAQMTAAQMGALTGTKGQVIYNTTDNKLYYWNAAAWVALT